MRPLPGRELVAWNQGCSQGKGLAVSGLSHFAAFPSVTLLDKVCTQDEAGSVLSVPESLVPAVLFLHFIGFRALVSFYFLIN